ncbi:N-acyl-D-glucosamine 2-epimerase [Paenibacillus chitinolyticus]|uniref:N-acyl-D-glucosamine 2-epimerase n=1 Tax=Paenibacillus chitinolyticus TaxID=79263 RepID=UPI003556542A
MTSRKKHGPDPRRSKGRLVQTLTLTILMTFLVHLLSAVPALAQDDLALSPPPHSKAAEKKRKEAALKGPSIQVDPSFPYYQNRSPESIADELLQRGYKTVHYFVVNETDVNRSFIEALQAKGIGVWALVLGNGSYSTTRFPSDWPSWQMELLKPLNDGYYRFSPHSPAYVQWKKQALAKLVRDYPFDGIEVAEPYFPEWDGINRGVYGDVGPLAQKAFRDKTGLEMPDFTNASSPRYYLTDTAAYLKWIDFRVETVNDFLNELMNGKGGVREARPSILVATWSLAIDAGPGSFDKLRELQGLDAAAMVGRVKPDIHFLQTHWPDWLKPQESLPPDYVKHYRVFADKIKAEYPDLPLGVQADIGSALSMVKDGGWVSAFSDSVRALGYSTWTAYEYHLGGYMYREAPVPDKAQRLSRTEVKIPFQKRIDEGSAKSEGNVTVSAGTQSFTLNPGEISVDGSNLLIRSDRLPKKEFRLTLRGIKDTPGFWFYNKTQTPNVIGGNVAVEVPKQ